jgi:hypothetical protein
MRYFDSCSAPGLIADLKTFARQKISAIFEASRISYAGGKIAFIRQPFRWPFLTHDLRTAPLILNVNSVQRFS